MTIQICMQSVANRFRLSGPVVAGLLVLAAAGPCLGQAVSTPATASPKPAKPAATAKPAVKRRAASVPAPVVATASRQFPPNDIRTNIIQIAPPAGWVAASYHTNLVDELGEFSPAGPDGAEESDVLGFSSNMLPRAALLTPVAEATEFMLAAQKKQCREGASRSISASNPRPGWTYAQLYCLGRTGAAQDAVEVTYFAQIIRGNSLFSVWRTWRGKSAPLKAMLKSRSGLDVDLVQPSAKGGKLDEKAIDRVTPALMQAFAPDLARAELCDLSDGEICDSYRPKVAAPSSLIALFDIRGTGELSAIQAANLAAEGNPTGFYADLAKKLAADPSSAERARLVQSITLDNHDWSTAASMQAVLKNPMLGARAAGGTVTALDLDPPASPALRARMQGYVILLSRLAWKMGIAPERETLILTSSAH